MFLLCCSDAFFCFGRAALIRCFVLLRAALVHVCFCYFVSGVSACRSNVCVLKEVLISIIMIIIIILILCVALMRCFECRSDACRCFASRSSVYVLGGVSMPP